MATLLSCATGNWTDASTWALADATSFLDAENTTAEVAVSPSWSASSTFTPGAITVDGVAVKVVYVGYGATGTISVCIGQGGTPVTGTTVTLNTPDVPTPSAGSTTHTGWIFFKFASPVTLTAATAYTVMAQESGSGQNFYIYTDATANNWARALRTTTTQAPAAGDRLLVCGEYTGQGTGNNFTVTMNNNNSTDFGTGSNTLASVAACGRGTLTWSYAATTALTLSGLLMVYPGGTLNIGTVANPIGASYTATITFDGAANGEFGIVKRDGGVMTIQGASRSYDRAYLAADAAISATSITTDVSTLWKSGDQIVIAPTGRTWSEYELCTLDGDASGTTVNLTAGLSYAHSGTAPTKAEIINLTRNVILTATNASYHWSMFIHGPSGVGSIDIDWVAFSRIGSSVTTGWARYGITVDTLVEIVSIQRCSISDTYQPFTSRGGNPYNFTFDNNVIYLYGQDNNNGGSLDDSTGFPWSFSGNWFIGAGTNVTSSAIVINGMNGMIDNNVWAGQGGGNAVNINDTLIGQGSGSFSGNVIHSIAGTGLTISYVHDAVLTDTTIWMTTANGFVVNAIVSNVTIDNLIVFGCANYAGEFAATCAMVNALFSGGSFHGYTGYACGSGFRLNSSGMCNVLFDGCVIGVPTGDYLDFTTQELALYYRAPGPDVRFHNCTWGSVTKITNFQAFEPVLIRFSKDGGVEGTDYAYTHHGYLRHDATEGIGGGDCLKMEPLIGSGSYVSLADFLERGMFQAPAVDGVSRTVYIQLKKSAGYNGANPDIALYQNGVLVDGWDACAVTTSYAEFSVSYTPTEDGVCDFAIRCDGTAGYIYVDGFRWA